VGAARVTLEVRPIRRRRVDAPGSAPGDGLAARRDDGANPPGHRIVRIGIKEGLVIPQRVTINRGQIGLLRAELANRSRSDRGGLLARNHRRWRVRCAFEEIKRILQLRVIPRNQCALGGFIDPEPKATEQIFHRQAAFAHHFGECLGIGRIGAGLIGRHGARGRVERDQHARIGLDQRQPSGQRRAGLGERIGPRHVEDHHAGLELQRRQRHRIVGQPQRFSGDIDVAGDFGVDRREIVLAFKLQSIAAKIDERDGLRSAGRCLVDKLPECPAQRFLVEIARPGHIEARGLQGLRDQARIVGRGRQGARLIVGIANHQCDASLGRCGRCVGPDCQKTNQQRGNDFQYRHDNAPTDPESQHCTESTNALNEF
jgi:hypothetical protein